jgi:hypothetical protein
MLEQHRFSIIEMEEDRTWYVTIRPWPQCVVKKSICSTNMARLTFKTTADSMVASSLHLPIAEK